MKITINKDKLNENEKTRSFLNRSQAYLKESDPLKVEAEYDAMKNGTDPDYTKWMEKVAEIKARYPFPE